MSESNENNVPLTPLDVSGLTPAICGSNVSAALVALLNSAASLGNENEESDEDEEENDDEEEEEEHESAKKKGPPPSIVSRNIFETVKEQEIVDSIEDQFFKMQTLPNTDAYLADVAKMPLESYVGCMMSKVQVHQNVLHMKEQMKLKTELNKTNEIKRKEAWEESESCEDSLQKAEAEAARLKDEYKRAQDNVTFFKQQSKDLKGAIDDFDTERDKNNKDLQIFNLLIPALSHIVHLHQNNVKALPFAQVSTAAQAKQLGDEHFGVSDFDSAKNATCKKHKQIGRSLNLLGYPHSTVGQGFTYKTNNKLLKPEMIEQTCTAFRIEITGPLEDTGAKKRKNRSSISSSAKNPSSKKRRASANQLEQQRLLCAAFAAGAASATQQLANGPSMTNGGEQNSAGTSSPDKKLPPSTPGPN